MRILLECLMAIAVVFAFVILTGNGSIDANSAGAVPAIVRSPLTLLEHRVKAVEQKTDYYKLNRITKSKSWKNKKFSLRSNFSPAAEAVFLLDANIGGSDPVVVNAWLHVSANYTASDSFFFDVNSGIASGDCCIQGNAFCIYEKNNNPAGPGSIDLKYFCQGVLNPQAGEIFRASTVFQSDSATFSISNLTMTAHLVNQIITEPPQ